MHCAVISRHRTVGDVGYSAKNAYAYFCLPTSPLCSPRREIGRILKVAKFCAHLSLHNMAATVRQLRCPEGPAQNLLFDCFRIGLWQWPVLFCVRIPRAFTAGVNSTSSVVLSNGSKQHLRRGGQVNQSAGSARQIFVLCSVEWQCESTRIRHRPTMRRSFRFEIVVAGAPNWLVSSCI